MQIVIDIPEELKNKCDELEFEKAINYVRWFDGTLTNAIKNGTILPDNATNGDVIEAMFPNEHDFETDFDEDWWNAPYQKGDM